MTYLIMALILILSYMLGGMSTARIIAKGVRSLNIYKIGTGLADTENIFVNVSKPLGLLVGMIDASKSYLYLTLVAFFLQLLSRWWAADDLSIVHQGNIMMLYAGAMLIGHCLPMTNKFRGGRGIFTYLGISAYFVLLPTIITTLVAGLLVFIWHQIRFSQYLSVIFPVLLAILFESFIPRFDTNLPPYFIPMAIGLMLLMAVLNFIVSKKLGEF